TNSSLGVLLGSAGTRSHLGDQSSLLARVKFPGQSNPKARQPLFRVYSLMFGLKSASCRSAKFSPVRTWAIARLSAQSLLRFSNLFKKVIHLNWVHRFSQL